MDHLVKSLYFVFVCLFGRLVLSNEEVHSQESYGGIYGNILKAMNMSSSLEYQNLTTLLKRLDLLDCSNKAGHQHRCVTAKSLFHINNISTESSLTDKDFAKFSTIIVYTLLRQDNPSTGNHRYVTENVNVYEEILERYTSSGFCERILDKLLRDLNRSVGRRLKKRKCFSSREILQELKLSDEMEITKSSLPLISLNIVSKLLDGQCINVGEETSLPCSSYFLKKLFKKYAGNDTMNKNEMDELLKYLRIGRDRLLGEQAYKNDNGHKRRRRNTRLLRRAVDTNEVDIKEDVHEKCYSVDELFSIYNVDEQTGVTLESFQRFATALIEQIESDICHSQQSYQNPNDHDYADYIPKISVWGFAFAAVSVVSLCSLVMIIPLMKTKFYEKSMVFLVSLAVGTLVGDALLHLLPHATGFHSHESDEYTAYKNKSYLWKFICVLTGVYGLFFFETTTHFVFRMLSSKKRENGKSKIGKGEMELKPPVVLINKIIKREEVIPEKFSDGRNFDQNSEPVKPSIASMAWTVIIGDTLHNIADGIAIGVAFSDSISGGLSTSIAVLCHEVPHELGDFVVLLSAGMSVRQALLANFLSACFCFLGLILGKSIGEIEDVNLWILGITAGFFLYIALTNKLPELMHVSEESELPNLLIFFLQQAGIILGFLGMFLLAYFKKDFDF